MLLQKLHRSYYAILCLKEIIEEVKKELNKMKDEIIKGKVLNYFGWEVVFKLSSRNIKNPVAI